MNKQETFHFFWIGPFSQWHKCIFKINGLQFNCAEQAMMYGKAMYFKDYKSAQNIMKTNDPRDQKRIGRQVEGFDPQLWNDVCKVIVLNANYAKFTQNPNLLAVLLDTKVDTFVEASPLDTVWGIGLAEDDERCESRNTWLGTNYLGEVITNVRDTIINGESHLYWNSSIHEKYFSKLTE